ncbi:MAG: SUMF1/EgtB/PvdO family nonheme iron enzyme [Bacteroidales bacterium]|nr:SUMF1/EgtB/PvdO family nonheme iron enzyme [Bacteroidales bacterium]
MKKLIYFGMGLFLCLSAAVWTGCDKPDEPETGGGTSGGSATEDVYGSMVGVVTDKDGGTLISMATVALLPTDITTQTDEKGAFSFGNLNAGTYQLRVSKDGYVVYTSDNIVLNAGQTVNRSISLEKEKMEWRILDADNRELSVLDLEKTLVFKLKNSGNMAVAWEVPDVSEAWIAGFSKQSGELEPGALESIELMINWDELSDGENEAKVVVTSPIGDKQFSVRAEMHFVVGPDYVETAFGMELPMVAVQGGGFMMGATSEQGRDYDSDERPVHQVMLDGFYIGRFEVTQAQWNAVMGTNPSYFKGDDNRPVEKVSWHDAIEFCDKLSAMTGKKYRLPTEAEWEYAARGGQQSDGTKYAGSNTISDVAWYHDNSYNLGASHPDYGTHPVGSKMPNGLGLYDMSGNVWEWCSDWYDEDYYDVSPVVNPLNLAGGEANRVLRGGSWRNHARDARVSIRFSVALGNQENGIGFRIVCEAE